MEARWTTRRGGGWPWEGEWRGVTLWCPLRDTGTQRERVASCMVGLDKNNNGAPRLAPESGENLSLTWRWNVCEGAGLDNMGNTCFLNATLQCLTYTAPLAKYLISRHHSGRSTENGFCIMCILERHTIATFSSKGKVIKPLEIVQNLKRIAKHLQFGKQEDVHEFFCYIVEALHLSCPINHHKCRPEEHVEKTSVVHHIFTGQLRSTVGVHAVFLHLGQIRKLPGHQSSHQHLLAAFSDFTKAETLDEYTCQRCCCKVKATKRMSLHHLPNVLALSIKRFDLFGNKINRDCPYLQHLDVRPLMSQQEDADPMVYRLYSVLVHSGKCSTEGHYYCYNKIRDGRWFRMDDDLVTPVDTTVVMEKQAYILFYVRSPEMKAIPVCSQINDGHGKWHQKRRQRRSLTPAINRHH
ncbi:ubiquitin carboxyl-terminal hydrolase 36-like isoform X1 [Petromyzon marinus]|uniref:ubiquitin carboxyl-terminal hydrolase 36-like isoform X1 n=2 Tax=Petromyzon marinus TaxID=7757 RepID=UPI003F6F2061